MGYFRDNIEGMAGYVPGFQPAGGEVVKLNTNENPYPPSDKVMDVLRGFEAERLRRYPQPMGDSFREAAAELWGVGSENIICTNGGDDLLNICFRAFCDDGRAAAWAEPTYSLYPVLAELQNCPVFKADLNGGKWEDELAEAGAKGARLVIVCNPNAPTGEFFDSERIAVLAERLAGKAVVLVDEAYADFSRDNSVGLVKEYDNLLVLRSMSKGYSLAGLRFGYGIAEAGLIEGLMKVKDSYNVDAAATAAATAAIKDQEYFRGNVEKIKGQRAELGGKLREMGFEVGESETNFLFVKPVGIEAGVLYEKLVERNIYVRYFNYAGVNDRLRITVGTADQNAKLVEAICELVK
jgi:histidinol-phosphate aminotransferase